MWILTPAALWTRRSEMHSWRSTTSSWVSVNALSHSSPSVSSLYFWYLCLAVHLDIDFFCLLCLFPFSEKWWERRRRRVTLWMYAPGITKSTASALWRSALSVWNSLRPPGTETLRRISELSQTRCSVCPSFQSNRPCGWNQVVMRDKTTGAYSLLFYLLEITLNIFFLWCLPLSLNCITLFLVIKAHGCCTNGMMHNAFTEIQPALMRSGLCAAVQWINSTIKSLWKTFSIYMMKLKPRGNGL